MVNTYVPALHIKCLWRVFIWIQMFCIIIYFAKFIALLLYFILYCKTGVFCIKIAMQATYIKMLCGLRCGQIFIYRVILQMLAFQATLIWHSYELTYWRAKNWCTVESSGEDSFFLSKKVYFLGYWLNLWIFKWITMCIIFYTC